MRSVISLFGFAFAVSNFADADTISIDVRSHSFVVMSAVPGQGTNVATIRPGDTVLWTWIGTFHSVTADDDSFDSGVHNPPFTFSRTFSEAGEYGYYCSIHGGPGIGMFGRISVQAAAAPTDIVLNNASVNENAPAGFVVGGLSTVDADQPQGHTYTLVDDGGGRFTIFGAELRVTAGANLDFEQAQSHEIRIRSTDATGLFFEKDFTIAVLNVTCSADVDGDGDIDISDLAVLLANFGRSDNPGASAGDLDGNGTVDLSDLAGLLAAFGMSC